MKSELSSFRTLLGRFTASDLMYPCSGTVDANTLVKDVLEEIEKSEQKEESRRKHPRLIPYSSIPDSPGADSLALVTANGCPIGCIDTVAIARLTIQHLLEDIELIGSGEWIRPVSSIMIPLERFSRLSHDCPALDAALELSRSSEGSFLVVKEEEIIGVIGFGCLLQPEFTLPLFGLILEIEQQILDAVSHRANEAFRSLSPGRQKKCIETLQRQPPKKTTEEVQHMDPAQYTVPLSDLLKSWLFPEEHSQRIDEEIAEWGAPSSILIEYTTFIDKGTMLHKLKLLPRAMSANDAKSFFKKAEEVRNAIAHGRPWWEALTSPVQVEEFIGQANECLHWMRNPEG